MVRRLTCFQKSCWTLGHIVLSTCHYRPCRGHTSPAEWTAVPLPSPTSDLSMDKQCLTVALSRHLHQPVNSIMYSKHSITVSINLTATWTHMPCYLPHNRGDIPTFAPAKLVLNLEIQGNARLGSRSWLTTYRDGIATQRWSPILAITRLDNFTDMPEPQNATAMPQR